MEQPVTRSTRLGMALFGISAAATAVRGVETLDDHPAPRHRHLLIAGLLIAIATVRAPG